MKLAYMNVSKDFLDDGFRLPDGYHEVERKIDASSCVATLTVAGAFPHLPPSPFTRRVSATLSSAMKSGKRVCLWQWTCSGIPFGGVIEIELPTMADAA